MDRYRVTLTANAMADLDAVGCTHIASVLRRSLSQISCQDMRQKSLQLVGDLQKVRSARINVTDRIIYSVNEIDGEVRILRVFVHPNRVINAQHRAWIESAYRQSNSGANVRLANSVAQLNPSRKEQPHENT